jgi:hypothetical protein
VSEDALALVLLSPAGGSCKRRRCAAPQGWPRMDSRSRSIPALARHQRFAGDDETRLAALHRVARAAPSVAMATRGGYGLTRLLDRIDWKLLAQSVERGTRWVGHSDMSSLQLGLLAHAGARSKPVTWAGPLAADNFGRTAEQGGVDEVTEACSSAARRLAIVFTEGIRRSRCARYAVGGNLAVGEPATRRTGPASRAAILFEDVNEHPTASAAACCSCSSGVLDAQRAIVLAILVTGSHRRMTAATREDGARACAVDRTPISPAADGPRADHRDNAVGARATLAVESATLSSAGQPLNRRPAPNRRAAEMRSAVGVGAGKGWDGRRRVADGRAARLQQQPEPKAAKRRTRCSSPSRSAHRITSTRPLRTRSMKYRTCTRSTSRPTPTTT